MRDDFAYPGEELEVFQHAKIWKRYLTRQLSDLIRGEVLEVGAGIGASTRTLRTVPHRHWTCLEPDRRLADRLHKEQASGIEAGEVQVVVGTLRDLNPAQTFDTVLYIDVLEHLADDREEVARAAAHLKKRGVLAVLSPAHPRLYTEFDRAIGHYRRYDRGSLLTLTPERCKVVRIRFLDSAGMLASSANRFLLRSAKPSIRQILVWDRLLVPISRLLDPLFAYRLGKSLLVAWCRT